jgi:hypothetical protein
MTPEADTRRSSDQTATSEAWIPLAPGDRLTGELIDLDTAWSDFRGSEYPLLRVRDDEGREWTIHAFRTVLYTEVLKWKPQVGERLTVTYHGPAEKAKAGMSPAEIYRVRVEGRPSADAARVYARLERAGKPEPVAETELGAEGNRTLPKGDRTLPGAPDQDSDFPF